MEQCRFAIHHVLRRFLQMFLFDPVGSLQILNGGSRSNQGAILDLKELTQLSRMLAQLLR